ncbi:hypothetical protein NUM_07840 [Actinocatenispora comari]|uniref:ATP/GTP-binding protein n=1 Tax=Actinocatenispora comari TaxID=2807577 RepID=A0A8J4A5T4_9ACTN|nr:hypothetical protein NUM_07840 [Actinocatenispora comari]
MHLRRATLIGLGAVVLAVSVPTAAAAQGVAGGVDCRQVWTGCNIHAHVDGHDGRSVAGGDGGASAGQSAAGDTRCENPSHQQIPCNDAKLGSVGSDGCYYKPTTRPAGRKQPSGQGGWYTKTCTGNGVSGRESLSHPVWRAGSTGGQPLLSPEQVAQLAVRRLNLPKPVIAMNPRGTVRGLVGVPVWLWVQAWPTKTASASVPGVSVTATAHPMQVVWSSGDGGRVVCAGPGTRWQAGNDPRMASPDCGHVFREASTSQPGHRFSVTATMRWQVRWQGAHRSGTVPSLSTSDSTSVEVAESQAVNTR